MKGKEAVILLLLCMLIPVGLAAEDIRSAVEERRRGRGFGAAAGIGPKKALRRGAQK